jgi:DNA-binding transcriptional LysR family regulator
MLPSMNALFAFEAAIRCGNFTRAAQELSVTPAAVSRIVSRLERHIGVQLLVRSPTGATLTENGKLLYKGIAEGFRDIEAALREIEARRTGTEAVTLSVSSAFTTHWLMPRMRTFRAAFPTVDLRFQLITGPLAGPVADVDLGMRFMPGDDEQHETALLMPEILLPICSSNYRRRQDGADAVRFDPMAQTIVNLSKAQPDWSDLFSPKTGSEEWNSLLFSDYAVVVQAALLGQGVALGWLTVVSHWMRTGDLVPAEQKLMLTGRECRLVRDRSNPVRPIVTAVRDWIIREMSADVEAIDRMYPALGLLSKASDPVRTGTRG